jgi:hypothetical protein
MASRQAVELACQVAADRRAKIISVNMIEVPFTLGLDVPLPDAEEKAMGLHKRILRRYA